MKKKTHTLTFIDDAMPLQAPSRYYVTKGGSGTEALNAAIKEHRGRSLRKTVGSMFTNLLP